MTPYTGLIDRYRQRLPVSEAVRIISLCEGNTPLIRLQNISEVIERDVALYVKVRGPESHGFLQGPGDDDGGHQGGGRGQPRGDLRLHGEHLRVRGGLCRPCRESPRSC